VRSSRAICRRPRDIRGLADFSPIAARNAE
jgi:hypothetical protein